MKFITTCKKDFICSKLYPNTKKSVKSVEFKFETGSKYEVEEFKMLDKLFWYYIQPENKHYNPINIFINDFNEHFYNQQEIKQIIRKEKLEKIMNK